MFVCFPPEQNMADSPDGRSERTSTARSGPRAFVGRVEAQEEAQSIYTAWYGRRLYPPWASVSPMAPTNTLRRALHRCVIMYQHTAACATLEIVEVEGQQGRRILRWKKFLPERVKFLVAS